MEDGSSPPLRVAQAISRTSDLTGEGAPINSLKAQHTLNQEHLARESMSTSTEWTNEKHSLYLKSMEASFVNDLYNSFDLRGCRSEREHSSDPKVSRRKNATSRSPSGQFKVLRSGCWEKISFERNKSKLENADGSGVLLANPWIRRFRSAPGCQIVSSSTLPDKVADLEQDPACHSDMCRYYSVGSNTEVTDQNFVDEDTGEKASNAKRIKTSIAATTCNDQVVPSAQFAGTTDVTDKS